MGTTLDRLNVVFQDLFDDEDLSVCPASTAKDVEGWDSMMQVSLILNVEKSFGVKFRSSEVASLQCVGDLVKLIETRQLGG